MLFLRNEELAWGRTFNCTVIKKVRKCCVQMLKRKQAHGKNGVRDYSKMYISTIDAENSAFNFRYNNKNITCKKD